MLSEHERVVASDMVDPRDIAVTFDGIGGLAAEKQMVRDLLVRPLAHPARRSNKRCCCRSETRPCLAN